MPTKGYGTVAQYREALAHVLAEDMPPKRRDLLRLHFEAPRHTATASELASKVGYKSYGGVNFQYGSLAREVASRMGITEKPRGFWLFVLVDWAQRQPPSGDTAFVLRPEVVHALRELGPPWTVRPTA